MVFNILNPAPHAIKIYHHHTQYISQIPTLKNTIWTNKFYFIHIYVVYLFTKKLKTQIKLHLFFGVRCFRGFCAVWAHNFRLLQTQEMFYISYSNTLWDEFFSSKNMVDLFYIAKVETAFFLQHFARTHLLTPQHAMYLWGTQRSLRLLQSH
jgi:hypothetical protein